MSLWLTAEELIELTGYLAVSFRRVRAVVSNVKERRDKQGMLLGPRDASNWLKWRKTRDKRIAKPRRLRRHEAGTPA